MANYWMHNGFLQVEGEKMSKSLGNFVTIHELLKDWPGEVVRLHHAADALPAADQLDGEGLREAQKMLDQWYALTATISPGFLCADAQDVTRCDDLNTPKAFADLARVARRSRQAAAGPAAACLKAQCAI